MAENEKKAPQMLDLEKFKKGGLKLKYPIKDGENEVTELHWDFTKLTGREYCDALDTGFGEKGNVFHMSFKQSLAIFAKAAAKDNDYLDEKDIVERISMEDAQQAMKLVTIFFNTTSKAGEQRILDA